VFPDRPTGFSSYLRRELETGLQRKVDPQGSSTVPHPKTHYRSSRTARAFSMVTEVP
jgi:hypothetical protein